MDIRPGIACLSLGLSGLAQYAGYGACPDVVEPDAGTRHRHVAGLGREHLLVFRFESRGSRSVIGIALAQVPAHVCLPYVGNLLLNRPQRGSLVEEETLLPVLELLILLSAVGQVGTARLDVLLAATLPGTVCDGQDIGIEVVLLDDEFLVADETVVPDTRDGTGHVGCSLRLVEDVAAVDACQVSKHVEVVDVVVAHVDVGDARHLASSRSPVGTHIHLHGGRIYQVGLTLSPGVPHHDLALQRLAYVARHLVDVLLGSLGRLVTSDVDVGSLVEGSSHLGEDVLEDGFSLLARHGTSHGSFEACAVSGHVNLGDEGHATLPGIVLQFAALGLCVVLL